ncbi:hypothetical protein [Streptomyces sp. NBC_01594]|uniref:hypothetical protein n=1 Tax=Streptomyces sp. NBC_01594 TaxID=2975890 RepID=UPI00386BFCF7
MPRPPSAPHATSIAAPGSCARWRLTVFAKWWLYFARPAHTLPATMHRGPARRFRWAHGHYLNFASAAGVRAGRPSMPTGSPMAPTPPRRPVAVPAAVLRLHHRATAEGLSFLLTTVLLLLAVLSPAPALATGILLALLAAVVTGDRRRILRSGEKR